MKELRKRYTKITKKRLDECLESIGWSTKCHGCDFYYIYNHLGKPTGYHIVSRKDTDLINDLRCDDGFGRDEDNYKTGAMVFVLKGCYMLLNDKALSILVNKSEDCNQPAFVSFYNFDKNNINK